MNIINFYASAALLAQVYGTTNPVNNPAESSNLQPPALIDSSASQRWLPFSWHEGDLIVLDVLVNGTPARAMIDTGSPDFVLSPEFAATHGIKVVDTDEKDFNVGGAQKVGLAQSVRLSFGGITQPARSMRVSALSKLEETYGKKIDLVIGASVLSRISLEVDFDHKRLRMRPSGSPTIKGALIPVALDPERYRVTLSGTISGRALVPVLLDTGANGAITLSAASFKTFQPALDVRSDQAATGAAGIVVGPYFRLPDIQFAGQRMVGLTGTAESGDGFLGHFRMAGSIGLGALSHYNFQLDAQRSQLVIQPRMVPDPSLPVSTTGVQWIGKGDRIQVVHVMKRSPAAAAGLHDGDEICSINGDRVTNGWNDGPMYHWGTVAAGKRYDVVLCNGHSVKLTTASFL